ncbi:unnamed protein product, partial [Meganyctiphanes norvegica]
YPNIHFNFMDMDLYFKGTALEDWFTQGVWNNFTEWPYMNLADAVRLLLVYRHGGVYMDSDFVSLRPLPSLTNWLGRQDESTIAAGAFHFVKDHIFMKKSIVDFLENFDGEAWANNGPGVITRVLKKLCRESQEYKLKHKKIIINSTLKQDDILIQPCGGVRVLKPETIYPIHFSEWPILFQPGMGKTYLSNMKRAYAVHVWNKLSSDKGTTPGDGSLYDEVARLNCPNVYRYIRAANLTL